MSRSTRSQSRQTNQGPPTSEASILEPQPVVVLKKSRFNPEVVNLGDTFTPKSTGLNRRNIALLRRKREKLRQKNTQLRDFIRGEEASGNGNATNLIRAVEASLVFAQEEAGTAVCISPHGLLLTCSHCVADDEEVALNSMRWLIFATGEVVQASCVTWDGQRDLALLCITAAEPRTRQSNSVSTWTHNSTSTRPIFPFAAIAPAEPRLRVRVPLICVGHPGSEDLEVDKPGVRTGYDVLHISEGRYRGLRADQDPQDNFEIGALMHDCWTYWGHSGAPLIERETGNLVGLHSSWDDETGMRRGVPLEAIRGFLDEHTSFEIGE